MSKAIAETPIFTGEDADLFEKLRMGFESLSKKLHAENTRKLNESAKKAKEHIALCI